MKKPSDYLVPWKIDSEASDPICAAMDALLLQRNVESEAVVFEVEDKKTGKITVIDLHEPWPW